MGFKNNYLLQISLNICMVFIYVGICIFMLSLSLEKESQSEFLRGSVALVVVPIMLCTIASIINFIINLFIKPKLFLYDDKFTYKDKTHKYKEIVKLEYNLGHMSRTHSENATLIIYCINKQKIEINNPSIRMIINMRKRCKDKPFKLTNWQSFVFTAVILFIVVILIMIFGLE